MLEKLDELIHVGQHVEFLAHVLAVALTVMLGVKVWEVIRDAMHRRTL